MRSVLVVGNGFGKLYKKVLSDLFEVDILDPYTPESVTYRSADEIKVEYDLAIICTPNHTHADVIRSLFGKARKFLVEKPGVSSVEEFKELNKTAPVAITKNNRYRLEYEEILSQMFGKTKIEILWLNKNRVPSPGSWFTDKSKAFGGVSHDLMPHLLNYFLDSTFGKKDKINEFNITKEQKYDLSHFIGKSTDYGKIYEHGVYDVDDTCTIDIESERATIKISASWKTDQEDFVGIVIEGKKYDLGLCPEYAYREMVLDCLYNLEFDENNYQYDVKLHEILDKLK